MAKKILLAGESWTSTATHIKGWDQFPSVTYHRGADDFLKVLADPAFDFTYMLCHEAAESFPATAEELAQYDAVTLRNWRSMRIGPSFIKIGKAVLYPVEELDRWDRSNLVQCRRTRSLAFETVGADREAG